MAGPIISHPNCLRCSGNDMFEDYSRGDVICRKCGEISCSRLIDNFSSEWNIFKDDDKDRGDFIARAGSIKNAILECETTLIGGPDSKRAFLLGVQNSLETKKDMLIIKTKEILNIFAGSLHLTPAIQVSYIYLLFYSRHLD